MIGTSILWFSTVGISKMGSVLLLGYPPDPPKGAAGVAVTARIEKLVNNHSMVFNSGDFKNGISFSFRILSDPAKGAWGGAGAYQMIM